MRLETGGREKKRESKVKEKDGKFWR